MKRKRLLIIGPRGSGKSTLAKILNADSRPIRHVQDTIYGKDTIDVPSAYLENTWMYRHLIALAQDARCVLMLFDARARENIYSPGFAKIFRIPVLGVITHYKDAGADRERVYKQCQRAGVGDAIVFFDGNDDKAIVDYLCTLKERKGI